MLRLALTFFMLIVATNLSLCMANPSPYRPLPTTPDKNEPTIIIREPANLIIHNDSKIHYSLTVIKPTSWVSNETIHGSIVFVWYCLDNVKEVKIADEQDNMSQQPFNYEGDLTNLSEGNHSLQIHVQSISSYNSFYNEADWHTWDAVEFYRMDTYSQKINFTIATSTEPIQTQTPISTSTPTSPIPTVNTGPEPPQTEPFPTLTVLVVASIGVAVVIASLLLYIRYRKTTTTSEGKP